MQSRRDQVEAQTYLLSRLTGALVSADPDVLEPPTRRDNRGLIAGVLFALLVAGVVALFALFSARGSTAWQEPGTLILDKTSGSRYVLTSGRLRPVLNLASAKLLIGTNLKTASVKTETLKKIPRGDPVGIPGAPDSLPTSATVNHGVWRVCSTTPDTPLTGYPSVGVVSDLGSVASSTRVGPSAGLLVSSDGTGSTTGTFLIWHGQALRLAGPWVADVLGWGDVAPLPVSPLWMDLIAPGPDLAPVVIPGRGDPGPQLDGQATRIGDLFQTGSGSTSPYYLLQRSGLVALTPTQYLLTSAQVTEPKVNRISAAGLVSNTAPRPADDGLPATPPEAVRGEQGQVPCMEYPGRIRRIEPDLVWSALPPVARPQVGQTSETLAGSDPRRAVQVTPGGGFLVQVPQLSDGQNASLLLVNDTGTAYPLAGGDAANALGYQADTALVIPPSFVRQLPSGPLLSAAGLR